MGNWRSVKFSYPHLAPSNLTMSNTADPSVQSAQQLLRQYMCINLGASAEGLDRATVRAALQTVAAASEYQILGICADDAAQGINALQAYLAALNYADQPVVSEEIAGPIYIKYNPKLGRCYADSYIGEHRGVLVSCQSAYEDEVNETFGHLPLDLFEPD
jgi:Domain of unknown function (DUF1824)